MPATCTRLRTHARAYLFWEQRGCNVIDVLWLGEVLGFELGSVLVDGEGVPPSAFDPGDTRGVVDGEDPGSPVPGLTEGELLTLPLPPGTTAAGDVVPVDVAVDALPAATTSQ